MRKYVNRIQHHVVFETRLIMHDLSSDNLVDLSLSILSSSCLY